MSTLRELADRLGVSVATVSRALNDKPGVGAETRRRVLELAQELQYQPNLAARSLATSRTQNVLFIVHRRHFMGTKDPFYPYIMQGLEEALTGEGYSVILVTISDSQLKAGPTAMSVFREPRPSAIVMAGPDISSSFILATMTLDIKTILVDNALRKTSLPAVLQDNQAGCRAATHHLIDVHGHENIALLRGPNGWISSEERTAGYVLEMTSAGLQPIIYSAADTTIETGQEVALQALQTRPETTAFVAINDAMAIGAIRAAREMGLNVPEDLAIVGFDNISWSGYADPPLTTVSVPMRDMGRMTARVLLDRINGTLSTSTRTIAATDLVVRASCGCSESSGNIPDRATEKKKIAEN